MAVSDQQLMQEDRNQLAIVPDRAPVSHGLIALAAVAS
jgi:hypothetical protein